MDITVNFTDNAFSLLMVGPDLATDNTLRTAVLVSLFSDRRAQTDDALPDDTDNRRGWWADAFGDIAGDLTGSRCWLLSRAKQTKETLLNAREYAMEALQWLLDDGIAQALNVSTEWVGAGILGLNISVTLPNGSQWQESITYPMEV